MNIPRRRIHVFGNELRFYPSETWTLELLTSALTRGVIAFNGRYYYLHRDPEVVASFDADRLWDLSNYVTTSMGAEVPEKHAKQLITWYGSSSFNYGDRADFYKPRNRL